jgi:DNA-binding CsgD family transcriptional regulator
MVMASGVSVKTQDDAYRQFYQFLGEFYFNLEQLHKDWRSCKRGTGKPARLSGVAYCAEKILKRCEVISIPTGIDAALSAVLLSEYRSILPELPPRSQIVDLDRFGLTPKQREVAELRYNYGLKTAYAIGKHLGKDPKTVADHLSAIDTRVSWQRRCRWR